MIGYNEQSQYPRQLAQGRTPVIIYRTVLLPRSETFVLHQGEDLKSYQAYYVGMRRFGGLDVPYDRTYVLNKNASIISRVKALAFMRWGFVGPLVRQVNVIQPVLIHAHFGIDAGLMLPLLKYCPLPLVVTYHGYDCTAKDEELARPSMSHRMYPKRREDSIAHRMYPKRREDSIAHRMYLKRREELKGLCEPLYCCIKIHSRRVGWSRFSGS